MKRFLYLLIAMLGILAINTHASSLDVKTTNFKFENSHNLENEANLIEKTLTADSVIQTDVPCNDSLITLQNHLIIKEYKTENLTKNHNIKPKLIKPISLLFRQKNGNYKCYNYQDSSSNKNTLALHCKPGNSKRKIGKYQSI